jgi:hypothetical protein
LTNRPSERLKRLSHIYGRHSPIPPIEAFRNAFARFIKANRESLLDITAAVAAMHIPVGASLEDVDPLLVRAIRDTNPTLTEDNLFSLGGDALQGAVNTAKGKYFEYLVVEKLNQGIQVGPLMLEEGQRAVLASSMTQPGWDLQIVDEQGLVVEYLQLKATDSIGYIKSALDRYPDIQILATGEVGHSGLVLDSGISDQALRDQVSEGVDALDSSLAESLMDFISPLAPFALMAIHEGYRLSIGQQSMDAFKLGLARRGQRMASAQLIHVAVYALGGGYLAVPASLAGGFLFDRVFNQSAMAGAYQSHRNRLVTLRLLQQDRALSRGSRWAY